MDALLDTADLVKDEDLVGGGGGGGGGGGPGNPAKNPKQHALSKRLSEAATLEPADAAGARCTLARCVIIHVDGLCMVFRITCMGSAAKSCIAFLAESWGPG